MRTIRLSAAVPATIPSKSTIPCSKLFIGRAIISLPQGAVKVGPASFLFQIQILLELLWCQLRFHAARRHLDFRNPKQGVEDDLPKIGVAPVFVKMAAGEPEAAAAVRALDAPHHVLGLALVL